VHQSPAIKLEAMGEKRLVADSKDKLDYGIDPKFDLMRAIINWFRPKLKSGFDIKIECLAPSVTGLGSSASAAVSMIACLNEWLQTGLTQEAMGLLAGDLEVDELGWAGGKQDGIADALGGVNQIFFGPGKTIKVKPLRLEPRLITGLLEHTVLFYIGGSRHSGEQQKTLIKGMSDEEKLKAMMAIKDMVDKALVLLRKENWRALGELMNDSWTNKKKTNPVATNSRVDNFYNLALKHGAFGGKLLGSGGAGHLFFFVDPESKPGLILALEREGARRVNFDLDYRGVVVKPHD
jgi:D-glycero-alpha-D-manno-heptose-7-phosphate kinase